MKVAECSIRVTVLLEYLDLAIATRSWLSNHNSVVCNTILLYYCNDQRRVEAMLENITLIAYLCLEFHVSLNSGNTKLANGGDHWGSLDI